MRRAVDLLDPRSGLELLRLEGLPPQELAANDDSLLQGIDIAEYYGGKSFESAERVVITQVKYSSRNPQEEWTYGRLAASRGQANTSPIRRLAEAYHAFRLHHSAAHVTDNLVVRLVSNQPAATALADTLDRAREIVASGDFPSTIAAAAQTFPSPGRAAVRRLLTRAELTDVEDGLRLLASIDLSYCGQAHRHVQKFLLRQELGAFVGPHARDGSYALHDMLYEELMPERADSPGVDRQFLLATLGASPERIYPVPCELRPIDRAVPTSGAPRVAQKIADGHRRIMAHGAAGIGKTTTLTTLSRELPAGSEVVAFDCFGDGRYLDATGEERHTVRRAVRQLFNEVSARFQLPMYLGPDMPDDDMWQRLRSTLEQASTTLPAGAVLVLAVDAADNSIVAANEHPEASFVPGLWGLRVPDNVVVLMTARSHRRDGLGEPDDVEPVELEPFDPDQSAQMLARTFEGAPPETAATFHERTGGNPRLQQYLLDQSASLQALEETLTERRTLEELFEGYWADAVDQVPSPEDARRDLARLVFMSRPLRVSEFARVSALSTEVARGVVSALEPGLHVDGDEIGFRDEPFDTFLRDRFTDEERHQAHQELLDFYLPLRDSDPVAARSVAQHLFNAGRTDELLDLALNEGKPVAIADDVQRLYVYRQRLARAMAIADTQSNPVAAAKLVYLAAEAAQTDSAVTSLVKEAPALFRLFSDPESVKRLLHADDSATWAGPAYMESAAVAGRLGDLTTAREQWDMAQAWIRRWSGQSEEQRRQWRLEVEHIAASAEAVFWLRGLRTAMRWLDGWGPEDLRWKAIDQFIRRIAPHLDGVEIRQNTRNDDIDVAAMLVAARWQSGLRCDDDLVATVARRLETRIRSGRVPHRHDKWGVDFCEALAAVPRQRTRARYLVRKLGPDLPNYGWPRWPDDDWPRALRRWSLRAALTGGTLTPDDIMPARIRRPGEHTSDYAAKQERDKFRASLNRVIPLYTGRARVIANAAPRGFLRDMLVEFERRTDQLTRGYEQPDPEYRPWVRLLVDALAHAGTPAAAKAARRVVDEAATALVDGGPWLYLQLGGRLVHDTRFANDTLGWTRRAVEGAETTYLRARDRWELLLAAAQLAVVHDVELARDYFEEAVAAAEGLDDDAALLLQSYCRCLNSVEMSAVDGPMRARVAETLASALEHVEQHVSDADYVPYREAVSAITRASVVHALAIASTWDDERRHTLRYSVPDVAPEVAAQDRIPIEALLRFVTLAGDWDQSEPVLQALDTAAVSQHGSASNNALKNLVDWILSDLDLDDRLRAARRVIRWAAEHGQEHLTMLEPLRRLIAFDDAGADQPSTEAEPIFMPRGWDELPVFPSAVGEVEAVVTGVLTGTASSNAVRDWLIQGSEASTVAVVIRLLEVLATFDYPTDPYVAVSVVRALGEITAARQSSARVQAWIATELPGFMERLAPALASMGRSAPRYLADLTQLPVVNPEITPMLRACARHMDSLDALGIQALAEVIVEAMSAPDACDVMAWGLDRLRGNRPAHRVPDMDARTAWVRFLYAQFGNAERSVRWRASHFARALLLADHGIIDPFVSELDNPVLDSFKADGLDPYVVSAKVQALVVLDRVAEELADTLAKYADVFAGIATDTAFPHAVMRHLAGRICHKLGVQIDTGVNEPASCLLVKNYWEGRDQIDHAKRETRYRFDSVDTIPYWFEPLGRVFAMSGHEIAERADDWLRDAFAVEEHCDDPRRPIWGERWGTDTYTRHGTIPSHEGLNNYLSYHSMCLVAGQLLDERRPVIVERDDYGWAQDQWQDWLEGHVPTSSDWWIADLRTKPPLERFTMAKFADEQQWRSEDDTEFLEALLPGAGSIIVSSYERAWRGSLDGERYVTSAIAPAHLSSSLLAALEGLGPDDYWLPRLDHRDHGNNTIDHGEYQLVPWLTSVGRDREGIDRMDPLARIDPSFHIPAPAWMEAIGAVPDGPLHWSNSDRSGLVTVTLWNDVEPDDHRHSSPGSSGTRTTVAIDELARALSDAGNDLILSVRLKKNLRRSGYDESDFDKGVHRVYRLRGDGSVSFMGRDPSAGEPNRSRLAEKQARRRARRVDGTPRRRAARSRRRRS